MGNIAAAFRDRLGGGGGGGGCECGHKRKRPRPRRLREPGGDPESDSSEAEDEPRGPRRKRSRCTSVYIYKTLFLHGENSDIKITALGQTWNLHKIYLCQSPYFGSMFSGSWKESSAEEVTLQIPDAAIDVEALQTAFGSLYRDDVVIQTERAVPLLAVASLLQLEGLMQRCVEAMQDCLSSRLVCRFHQASLTYGQSVLANSVDLMDLVVSSSELFVMQVEMDIYSLLKKWLFLQVFPAWEGSLKELATDTDAWLKAQREDGLSTTGWVLDSACVRVHSQPFRSVRLQHVLNDLASSGIVERDRLVPHEWLMPLYRTQWLTMLRVEQDLDKGPVELDLEALEKQSLRCGRKLNKDGEYCWRWTGYAFGLDLLVSYSNRLFVFKRNTYTQQCSGAVSLAPTRSLCYRLRVISLDAAGKIQFQHSTGYQTLSLEKDQEQAILVLDSKLVTFPLFVCCNFLYLTPPVPSGHQGQSQALGASQ
ncbi:germ cell-less protein-like 1 isoform X2 [Lampetra fluviatilis]